MSRLDRRIELLFDATLPRCETFGLGKWSRRTGLRIPIQIFDVIDFLPLICGIPCRVAFTHERIRR